MLYAEAARSTLARGDFMHAIDYAVTIPPQRDDARCYGIS